METLPQQGHPRLLVSVRNAAEARAATDGGCDILDIKEPSRGSLGMADLDRIADVVGVSASTLPLSAALGELADWNQGAKDEVRRMKGEFGDTAGARRIIHPSSSNLDPSAHHSIPTTHHGIPRLPDELEFLKLGLAKMAAAADWIARWLEVRRQFDETAGCSFGWIAVAYADWRLAEAPRPEEIAEAAAATGCCGVLLDTYAKTGRTLLDWMDSRELTGFVESGRRHGLHVALAGSLRLNMLPELLPAHADILAIRTAACRNAQRSAAVDSDAVRAFKSAMLTTETTRHLEPEATENRLPTTDD